MSIFKKLSGLAIIAMLCIPFLRTQSRFDVDIEWSIQEENPKTHVIGIQNVEITVLPGQTVRQSLKLKGGSRVAAPYAVRGWGFRGQQVTVDGIELPLSRIKATNRRGSLLIGGIGRSVSMDASIDL
ncbi:hypothetical protein [Luteolibacter sp. AS25]|uniref:hypothetical protein n=1 Tax=Luteolibacter sp. AS25 TaxID=3135776 RepID=UPI00398B643D